MRLINEPAQLIAKYVGMKTSGNPNVFDNGPFSALGLVDQHDRLVAGIVFNHYAKPNIAMSIAAERMTPGLIAAAMAYAFNQLGCKRITGFVEKHNRASRRFALHLGARLEGTMRDASPSGNVCVYGLLKQDATRWLTPRYLQKLQKVTHG